MTENPDRIERTIELLLYAPIGVGLCLKDTAPQFVDMFVSRGRAEIARRHDEVQQRVTTARSLGQVAMAFGPPIVRERGVFTLVALQDHGHPRQRLAGRHVSDPPHDLSRGLLRGGDGRGEEQRQEVEAGNHGYPEGRSGTTTAEHEELVELRKEVRELRRANDILQAAASFVGAELDRRHTR